MTLDEQFAIGMLDTIEIAARYLVKCNLSSDLVQDCIKGVRKNPNLHQLMDMGDLVSAKARIQEQNTTIKFLMETIELFKNPKIE